MARSGGARGTAAGSLLARQLVVQRVHRVAQLLLHRLRVELVERAYDRLRHQQGGGENEEKKEEDHKEGGRGEEGIPGFSSFSVFTSFDLVNCKLKCIP